MRSDAWAGELSRCNIQVWFSHNPGLLLRKASLKRATTSWYNCLPSDHVVQVHNGQCFSNQKTQPTTPWSLTDSSVHFFLVEETLSPSTATIASCNWNVSVNFLPSLLQNFTHTLCSSSSFIVNWSLIRRTACARAHFSGCSSTTNAHNETGLTTVCCQNLTLGALSSRSALSMLVGAPFKKFGLFFNSLVFRTKKKTFAKYAGN